MSSDSCLEYGVVAKEDQCKARVWCAPLTLNTLAGQGRQVVPVWGARLCRFPSVPRPSDPNLYCLVPEPCSGSGWSWFQIAAASSHEPSGCWRRIQMYFPVSVSGSAIPSANVIEYVPRT